MFYFPSSKTAKSHEHVLFVFAQVIQWSIKKQARIRVVGLLMLFVEMNEMKKVVLGFLIQLLLSHFSRVQLCATPETAAHRAPPSLGFARQEHWSGLPYPSPVHESER